jgi:pilus assembly protein CpaE
MQIYFLGSGLDPAKILALENAIRASIPQLTRIDRVEDISGSLFRGAKEPAYVLFAGPTGEKGFLDKLIETAERFRQQIFFILIGDAISAEDYKRLLRTGGADWVSTASVPHEINELIARRRRAGTGTAPGDRVRPVVVSFVPSGGGVGNSTLAIEVAVRLKAGTSKRARKVCLLDLDFQNSHVCDYLDLEPHLKIEEIAAHPERLDSHLFEIFISHHSSGLDVFAAPRNKVNFSDLNVSALDALFDMMSRQYEVIVIDLPATWFPWTHPVLASSDGILVTGINTIPCLHQISETLAAVRAVSGPSDQLAVAINRCERGLMGGVARQQHVKKVLEHEKLFYIYDDPMAVEDVNMGMPMALAHPRGKASKGIAALAAFCAGFKSLRTAAG